jgi:hypothetical protein
MTAEMVYLQGTEEYVVYNWYSGALAKLAPTVTLEPGYEGNAYAVVSPIESGWAFIGEVDKYVPASTLRFPGLAFGVDAAGTAALTVSVSGIAGETVKVCAAEAAGLKLVCQSIKFAADGTKTASFPPVPTS